MDEVSKIENDLREAEAKLESIGREICTIEGSILTWNAINAALEDVREAIHNAYRMRK